MKQLKVSLNIGDHCERILSCSLLLFFSKGAKAFASETLKISSEYASPTGEILQERLPITMKGM